MAVTTKEDAGSLRPAGAALASVTEAPGNRACSDVELPDEPLVVIEPTKSWAAIDLRGIWSHRELLYFLVWRDVKIRYKQTLLGATWAIIQPLFTMLIFTMIFGRVAQIGSEGIPYPVFAYAALLPWTFFSNSVANSSNSLVASAHVITKVYFPRVIIPAAAVGAGLVDFAFACSMLIVLMAHYRISPTVNILFLPALVLLTTLLATALGMWLSALNVKYRDVRFAIPFLMQVWMYLSPIAYPSSIVPPQWRFLYSLNPFAGIVDGYRSAIFGRPFAWTGLGISTVITLGLLVYASLVFRKMEKTFADIV